MKIISLNLNGIRSASSKGVFDWLPTAGADILCVQELKAQAADMTEVFLRPPVKPASGARAAAKTFHGAFHYAEKKGYSGVGLYSKAAPTAVQVGFADKKFAEFEREGRLVQGDFATDIGTVTVLALYQPSGSSGEERQAAKFRFLELFYPYLAKLMKDHRAGKREVVVCADWNIAHKEIDLKNWKSNQKNSGFLPEERAWLTQVIDELGYVDVFRQLDDRPEQYTWWSQRGAAYEKNVGWRLDYQLVTPGLAAKAKKTGIYLDQRFSDHAPMWVDYGVKLLGE
jgi:exodeoxyribonuclease III